MRNFVLGLAAGVTLAVVASFSIGYYWLRSAERPPAVPARATLVLRISGDVPERLPFELAWPGNPARALTTFGVWDSLRKAAADGRIEALVVQPEGVSAGWATLAEIRDSILAFGKSGKPVTAFLSGPSARDYYLASAAGRITMPPGDVLNLKGLRAELLYARGALDKLGITPEFEAIGKYKDGADTLTRRAMSAETREVMNEILDQRFADLVGAIAAGRGKTAEQVRVLIDEGPFLAEDAVGKGLVDATAYRDETLPPAEAGRRVMAADYQRVPALSLRLSGPQRIAYLTAEGDIFRSAIPGVTDEILEPDAFGKLVREIAEDARIRAVVLRIDSPGGDAIASDEMLRELKLLAKKKPLVVSMADVAASGGYALAMAGVRIVAYPQTITGSIGVFFGKLNLEGLYGKLGIEKQILARGRFAAIDSDARALTPEERAKLRRSLEQVYGRFVRQVAEGRKRPVSEIEPLAEGRVWLGSQARANGLVDSLGGISLALSLARKEAGIADEAQVEIEVYPRRPGIWEALERRPWEWILSRQMRAPLLWKRLPYGIEVR